MTNDPAAANRPLPDRRDGPVATVVAPDAATGASVAAAPVAFARVPPAPTRSPASVTRAGAVCPPPAVHTLSDMALSDTLADVLGPDALQENLREALQSAPITLIEAGECRAVDIQNTQQLLGP